MFTQQETFSFCRFSNGKVFAVTSLSTNLSGYTRTALSVDTLILEGVTFLFILTEKRIFLFQNIRINMNSNSCQNSCLL